MSRDTERAAIGRCIRASMAAKDGRARNPATSRCAADMGLSGPCETINLRTALAAAAVGQHLRGLILEAGFAE